MRFVKYHNVVLPGPVKDSFVNLAGIVSKDLGFAIEPVEGYKSDTQVIEELKKRIKYPDKLPSMDSAIINSLADDDFEPPLNGSVIAMRSVTGNELVAPIPNRLGLDPRPTGRLIQFGPKNLINPTLLYYLVHNAGRYGFLHYGPKDPSVWYWRGDKDGGIYTPQQVVSTFTNELAYLL
jgi:hypothetical protein